MGRKPKPKKCTECKTEFTPWVSTQLVCSPKCGIEYARKKEKKKKEKENRAAVKELRRKSLKWQHEQTQKAFNKLRVLQEKQWFKERGLEPTCISCGKPNMDWCCGHFKTRGAQPELRYDPKNTFLQCNRYCNMALSGNIEGNKNTRGYKQGLIERFGDEGQEILDYLDSPHDIKKWTWQELEELRTEINKKIRELENNHK